MAWRYDPERMASEPLPPVKRRRGLPASPGTIGLIALGVLVTVFAVLNLESVKVDWIVHTTHAPLIVVIRLEQFDYAGAAAVGLAMVVISFGSLLLINAAQVALGSRRQA